MTPGGEDPWSALATVAAIWLDSSSAGITTAIFTAPTIARAAKPPDCRGPGLTRSSADIALTALASLPYQCRVTPPTKRPSGDPSSPATAPSYARTGVDLDHDEDFVDEIREIARTTFRPEILSSIGGFAGLFKAPDRYEDPIFAAATKIGSS